MSTQQSPNPRTVEFSRFFKRFLWVAAYMVSVSLFGTVGYSLIDGVPLFDAFYMTVVTATSVGFGEIWELSEPARYFTILVIVFGMIGLGLWWALMTALIVETDLGDLYMRRKMNRKIEKLNNHYIVCGVGRMGKIIVEEMLRVDVPFVVVDRSTDQLEKLRQLDDSILFVEGDATKENTLIAAGIDRAQGVASVLADDADNLFLVLTARGLEPDIDIVSRAYDEESLEKLRRAGATHTISPNITGAVRMASTLLRPSVVTFLDAAVIGKDIKLRLEEAVIPPNSSLVNKRLADAKIPQRTGLIVLALRRAAKKEKPLYNPGPNTELQAGDVMIVVGSEEQIGKLRSYAAMGEVEVE